MSVGAQECSCEAFLWHPLCIPYEHASQRMVLNDDYLRRPATGGEEGRGDASLGIDWPGQEPGNEAQGERLVGSHEAVQSTIERWVKRRGWVTLRLHHAIIDPGSMRAKIVDYIFKERGSQRVWLAVVYRAVRRGGARQRAMSEYIASVAHTCKRQMNFSPGCVVICVHGAAGDRVYSKRIEWG